MNVNVVKLSTVSSVKNQQTIDALKFLLEKAEKGELVGFACIGLTGDGGIVDTSTSVMHENPYLCIGALEKQKEVFLADIE